VAQEGATSRHVPVHGLEGVAAGEAAAELDLLHRSHGRSPTVQARFPASLGPQIAAEIGRGGPPHPDGSRAPWLVVPSEPGATPLIYSSEEALAHLDPSTLSPEKHGLLVVAPRASNFFRSFDAATQRKLLDAVARGMTLLVLQQDYTSGRYPLSWLPQPPKVETHHSDLADPGGALGLE
jgi:hypothetical protein